MRETFVLDTDIWTLYFRDDEKGKKRVEEVNGLIGASIITRVEVLRGRFDFLFKAANAAELQKAMERLTQSERDLKQFHEFLVDTATGATFDKLLKIKKLKTIGRGDLLIASIALANKAVLVTRNLKDFKQVPDLKVENWAD